MKKGLLYGVLCLLGTFPAILHAQDKAQPYIQTTELESIVVTASKVPQTQSNITQRVDSITEDEIDLYVTGKINISELLTYEPGFFINVLSRNDANWGATTGLPHKYVTYMLGGLPVDSFVDPQSLDPWAFQRIEIQRGPASVLYPNYLFMDFAGNQSPLGGTVNMILRDRVDRPMTKISADYGSYNTVNGHFYHQNLVGNFHFFLGGAYQQSDYTDYGTNPSWLNMLDDPEYQKTKVYGQGTYFFDDSGSHKLSVFAHHTDHSGDAGRPNRDFGHNYDTVNASYQIPITESLTGQAKVGYRNYDRTWEEDNFPRDLSLREEDSVKQYIVPTDFTLSYRHLEGGLLTLGTDFQYADYTTYAEITRMVPGSDAHALQSGFYIQEEFTLNDWVLRAGGRYNYTRQDYNLIGGTAPSIDDASWNQFLWSAGVRYNALKELSLYSNVGTSYTAPGIMSIVGTLSPQDLGVPGKNGRLPNPSLDAESGLGVDFGIDCQPTSNLYLGTRLFYNKIDDQIVQIVVSQDPSQAMDVNAGKTTSYGVEVELKHRLNSWLQWFANYTYTHSKIDNDTNPDQDGVEVPFVPEHMGNIGVQTFLPYDITAALWLHVVGTIYDSTSKSVRNKFDAYELLNATVEKALIQGETYKLTTYVDLYNLTNKKFEMPWQFQDPGFAASGGLRLVF
jgi:outer membrane receptor protein involved in Fe transport